MGRRWIRALPVVMVALMLATGPVGAADPEYKKGYQSANTWGFSLDTGYTKNTPGMTKDWGRIPDPPQCFIGGDYAWLHDIRNFDTGRFNGDSVYGSWGAVFDLMYRRVGSQTWGSTASYNGGVTEGLNPYAFAWQSARFSDGAAPDLVAAALWLNGGRRFSYASMDDRTGWLRWSSWYDPYSGPAGRIRTFDGGTNRWGLGVGEVAAISPVDASRVDLRGLVAKGPLTQNDVLWAIQDRIHPGLGSLLWDIPRWYRFIYPDTSQTVAIPDSIAMYRGNVGVIDQLPIRVIRTPAGSSVGSGGRPGEGEKEILSFSGSTNSALKAGDRYRVVILIPNRPHKYATIAAARSAFKAAWDDKFRTRWNEAAEPGGDLGAFRVPLLAKPNSRVGRGTACGDPTFRLYDNKYETPGDGFDCAITRNVASRNSECDIIVGTIHVEPKRVARGGLAAVLGNVWTVPMDPDTMQGAAVVGVPYEVRLDTSRIGDSPYRPVQNIRSVVDPDLPKLELNLTNLGVSIEVGDWFWKPFPRQGDDYGTIEVTFDRTPTSVLQDPACRGLTKDQLLDHCGITFIKDPDSGSFVPAFRIVVRTWWDGIFILPGDLGPSGSSASKQIDFRGVFHPRYTIMSGAGLAGRLRDYWSPWNDSYGFSSRVDDNFGWPAKIAFGCTKPQGDDPDDPRKGCGSYDWLRLGSIAAQGLPSAGSPMWDAGGRGSEPLTHIDVPVYQVQPGTR